MSIISWLFTWCRSRLEPPQNQIESTTIEQYVLRNDPYRITTAAHPLPLPVQKRAPVLDPSILQSLEELMPKIREIVDPVINDSHLIHFCRLVKSDYALTDSSNVTLRVEIYHGSEESTGWSKVKDGVQSLLSAADCGFVDVEIVDESRAVMPSMFPQSSKSEPIILYESVRDQITSVLIKRLPDSWNSMSLFKLGRNLGSASSAVVVFVEPFAVCQWESLQQEIQALLVRKNPNLSLKVEFVSGRVWNNENERAVDFRLGNKSTCARMGSSIGVDESEVSGSLGGFMKLKIGNHIHEGFLTNHHVIAHNISQESLQMVNEKGYQYCATNESEPRPWIQYPSPQDLKYTKKEVTDRMNRRLTDVEEMKNQISERKEAEARVTEGYKSTYQNFVKLAQDEKRTRQGLDQWPHNLGHTLISSGHAINSTKWSILDWAFVKFSQPARNLLNCGLSSANELPSHLELNVHAKRYNIDLNYVDGSPPAPEFGTIQKDHWYFKRGRTSHLTVGICNGTELTTFGPRQSTSTQPADDSNKKKELPMIRYTETGKAVDLKRHPTHELVILNFDSDSCFDEDPQYATQVSFSELGDSGSLVIDRAGRVCGLLWGSHSGVNEKGKRMDRGAGVVTSMEDVVASVGERAAVMGKDGKKVLGKLSL